MARCAVAQEPAKQEASRTTEPISAATKPDPATGIVRHQGIVYFLKNGKPQRVKGKLELSEGLIVQEDGTIIFRTRQSTSIREGEIFHFNGDVRPLSPELRKTMESFSASGAKTK